MKLQLDREREYGIVLEGGGAKGAYQIGAWKALREAGIRIRGAAGTSVGALNGALICMDDLKKAEEIWGNIRYSRVMDVDDNLIEQIRNLHVRQLKELNLGQAAGALKRIVKDRGLEITPLRNLIEEIADEARIRSSDRELYVVTYSLSDRQPVVADLKQVPEGEIADMLMASAYLIGFRPEKLGGKYYIDGASFNNVPADVLIDKGYKDIIVLRIYGIGVDTERHLEIPEGVNLYHVAPRQELGGILEFNRKRARKNMLLGYFDAKRLLYGLEGRCYYLDAQETEVYYLDKMLSEIQQFLIWMKPEWETELKEEGETQGLRLYTESIFPKLSRELRLKDGWNYKTLYLSILEELAKQYHISRFKIYTPGELASLIHKKASKALKNVSGGKESGS